MAVPCGAVYWHLVNAAAEHHLDAGHYRRLCFNIGPEYPARFAGPWVYLRGVAAGPCPAVAGDTRSPGSRHDRPSPTPSTVITNAPSGRGLARAGRSRRCSAVRVPWLRNGPVHVLSFTANPGSLPWPARCCLFPERRADPELGRRRLPSPPRARLPGLFPTANRVCEPGQSALPGRDDRLPPQLSTDLGPWGSPCLNSWRSWGEGCRRDPLLGGASACGLSRRGAGEPRWRSLGWAV